VRKGSIDQKKTPNRKNMDGGTLRERVSSHRQAIEIAESKREELDRKEKYLILWAKKAVEMRPGKKARKFTMRQEGAVG